MRHGLALRLFAAAIACTALLDVTAALAADAESDALEEVVVTARHKEETLQSIPLAVTAFTSEDIARSGIQDMRDIASLTPGFSFQTTNGGGNTNPVIRGAAQVVETLEQNVSFFLDGIYLPRDYVTNLGFDLLERVEVVEGPQSARYGRNAFMGAVNYVSRTPSEDFKAEATGTIENHSSYIGTAFASGAVITGHPAAVRGRRLQDHRRYLAESRPLLQHPVQHGYRMRARRLRARDVQSPGPAADQRPPDHRHLLLSFPLQRPGAAAELLLRARRRQRRTQLRPVQRERASRGLKPARRGRSVVPALLRIDTGQERAAGSARLRAAA